MNSGEKVITAFAVGIGLGAVLGILFAPEKGSTTRSKIKEEVDVCYSKVTDAIDKLKEKAEEIKNKARNCEAQVEEELEA